MEGYIKMNGVWVDERLPQEIKENIAKIHEEGKAGKIWWSNKPEDGYDESRLRTMYEHAFLLGSGVGIPPEPHKPLCAQHEGADLEEIIEARRRLIPPGEEFVSKFSAHLLLDDFYEITGLPKGKYSAVLINPDIAEDGTVGMYKVARIIDMKTEEVIDLSEEVIARLNVKTKDEHVTGDDIIVRWEFSPEYGMKITYLGREQLDE